MSFSKSMCHMVNTVSFDQHRLSSDILDMDSQVEESKST
jgi:hypothetical protein